MNADDLHRRVEHQRAHNLAIEAAGLKTMPVVIWYPDEEFLQMKLCHNPSCGFCQRTLAVFMIWDDRIKVRNAPCHVDATTGRPIGDPDSVPPKGRAHARTSRARRHAIRLGGQRRTQDL